MAVGKEIPKWAKGLLSEKDVSELSEAVAKAEKSTTGEIVPMIVERSSLVDHLPMMLIPWFLVLLFFPQVHEWPTFHGMGETNALMILSVAAILGGYFLCQLPWVQRMLLSAKARDFQVDERAELEFYEHGLHKTKGRTGVLLFVSLMERRVVVLADEQIANKVPKDTWNALCVEMTEALRRGQAAQGMNRAIQHAGQVLTQHFPAQAGDTNELSNQLILKQ